MTMSEFTERLRDYGLTLDEHEIIHDRRVVDEAADIIDEMESILKDFSIGRYDSARFIGRAIATKALEKLERAGS